MDISTSRQKKHLDVLAWILIGLLVFLPLLLEHQWLAYIQLICLALLVALQFKAGTQSKLVVGFFCLAYAILAALWAIGP